MLRQLGPADALVPPLPVLVRYKEAIAVKAETTSARSVPASPVW